MDKSNSCIVDVNRSLLQKGPKFLSHKLITQGDLAYLRPTITAMLFCVIYIIIGAFLIGVAIYQSVHLSKYDLAIFVGGFGIAIGTLDRKSVV